MLIPTPSQGHQQGFQVLVTLPISVHLGNRSFTSLSHPVDYCNYLMRAAGVAGLPVNLLLTPLIRPLSFTGCATASLTVPPLENDSPLGSTPAGIAQFQSAGSVHTPDAIPEHRNGVVAKARPFHSTRRALKGEWPQKRRQILTVLLGDNGQPVATKWGANWSHHTSDGASLTDLVVVPTWFPRQSGFELGHTAPQLTSKLAMYLKRNPSHNGCHSFVVANCPGVDDLTRNGFLNAAVLPDGSIVIELHPGKSATVNRGVGSIDSLVSSKRVLVRSSGNAMAFGDTTRIPIRGPRSNKIDTNCSPTGWYYPNEPHQPIFESEPKSKHFWKQSRDLNRFGTHSSPQLHRSIKPQVPVDVPSPKERRLCPNKRVVDSRSRSLIHHPAFIAQGELDNLLDGPDHPSYLYQRLHDAFGELFPAFRPDSVSSFDATYAPRFGYNSPLRSTSSSGGLHRYRSTWGWLSTTPTSSSTRLSGIVGKLWVINHEYTCRPKLQKYKITREMFPERLFEGRQQYSPSSTVATHPLSLPRRWPKQISSSCGCPQRARRRVFDVVDAAADVASAVWGVLLLPASKRTQPGEACLHACQEPFKLKLTDSATRVMVDGVTEPSLSTAEAVVLRRMFTTQQTKAPSSSWIRRKLGYFK